MIAVLGLTAQLLTAVPSDTPPPAPATPRQQCVVDITADQRFLCPCHQSRFANDGSVINGPAARPLDELPTSYNPATDQLTIG